MSTTTRKSKGSWVYIGNQVDEKQTKQVAQCGDIVESDTMLFDAKGNAVGTQFIFVGLVEGSCTFLAGFTFTILCVDGF